MAEETALAKGLTVLTGGDIVSIGLAATTPSLLVGAVVAVASYQVGSLLPCTPWGVVGTVAAGIVLGILGAFAAIHFSLKALTKALYEHVAGDAE